MRMIPKSRSARGLRVEGKAGTRPCSDASVISCRSNRGAARVPPPSQFAEGRAGKLEGREKARKLMPRDALAVRPNRPLESADTDQGTMNDNPARELLETRWRA